MAAKLPAWADNSPCLLIAFQDNRIEFIKAYVDQVLDSNLNNETKKNLLQAKSNKDLPGVIHGLNNDNTQAFTIYINKILESNLPEMTITDLLSVSYNGAGLMGFLMNRSSGDALALYKHAVSNSTLQESSKQMLLKS